MEGVQEVLGTTGIVKKQEPAPRTDQPEEEVSSERALPEEGSGSYVDATA